MTRLGWPDRVGLRYLLDNGAPAAKDGKERTAFRAPDALSNMDRVSVVNLSALRACNVNHDWGAPSRQQNNILFWDSKAGLAIIQPS